MNKFEIICERPYMLFSFLIIIPAVLFFNLYKRKDSLYVDKSLKFQRKNDNTKRLLSFNKMTKIRSIFHCLALCMIILAYSKISWGSYLVPVQKSATSVSFVFDISNSMLAKDGYNGTTRLESSAVYAKKLLEKMENNSVSVVIAKGDGVVAIPITEDKIIVESLLESLNPKLMTSPGSSIGKGILRAKETFEKNYSTAGRIWVFTDGEETDNQLKNALTECIKSGIPVSIIGFGSEKETSVYAGDGITTVQTALRTKAINDAILEVNKKTNYLKNKTQIQFVKADEKGSAAKLINQLITKENSHITNITTYEEKPVPRYKLFLLLAILFFAFSFIFTEFDFTKIVIDSSKKISTLLIVFLPLILTSCSSQTKSVFEGTLSWHKKHYKHSVSCFLEAQELAKQKNQTENKDYFLYNLATSYAMLNEEQAAMEKFSSISTDASDEILFSTYYNAGVICYKNADYENALNYFRKALEIDNTRMEAKINMELTLKQSLQDVSQKAKSSIPASEEKSSMPEKEKAVFEHIKENDKKQWKNSESTQNQDLSNDY